MNSIKQELSAYLNSLVVNAQIDAKAHAGLNFTFPNKPGAAPYFTVKYKDAECSFSLVDGSPLKDNISIKIQPILPCIAQMWIEKREYIIKACKEVMGFTNLQSNNDDEDDNLPWDKLYIASGHEYRRRKRPWLDKAKENSQGM